MPPKLAEQRGPYLGVLVRGGLHLVEHGGHVVGHLLRVRGDPGEYAGREGRDAREPDPDGPADGGERGDQRARGVLRERGQVPRRQALA